MRDHPLAYVEAKQSAKTDSGLVGSVISHWHSRFLYGKAIIITENPEHFVKLAKKRWLSLMQSLQHERSRTIDADKLLNITHSITRMQQMAIANEAPHEFPAAHFWCITPQKLETTELPRTCHTIYTNVLLSESTKRHLYAILPNHSLVVDFADNNWELEPKQTLDTKVYAAWGELTTFLEKHDVNIKTLVKSPHNIDTFDNALDNLLDKSSSFLRHARQFQEALHLAQPLQLSHTTKQEYELANTLARRVSLLTPGLLHHSLAQNDNEAFSLYDAIGQKVSRESLSAAIARHVAAGRQNLARALEIAFVNNTLIL